MWKNILFEITLAVLAFFAIFITPHRGKDNDK